MTDMELCRKALEEAQRLYAEHRTEENLTTYLAARARLAEMERKVASHSKP